MAERPTKVTIFGKLYSIQYMDNPSNVDHFGRKSLWGQLDHWAHSIRVYAPPAFSNGEVWDTIFHEILHALAAELKLDIEENEDDVALLALGLADVLLRNEWLRKEFVE